MPVATRLVYGNGKEVGEAVGGDVGHVVLSFLLRNGSDAVTVDESGIVGRPADVGVVGAFGVNAFINGVDRAVAAENEPEPEDVVFADSDFAWQVEGVVWQG